MSPALLSRCGGGSSGLSDHRETTRSASVVPAAGATATFSFVHDLGQSLLDYTTPTAPKVVTSGDYIMTANVLCNNALAANAIATVTFDVPGAIPLQALGTFVSGGTAAGQWLTLEAAWWFLSTRSFSVSVLNGAAVARSFQCTLRVLQLA